MQLMLGNASRSSRDVPSVPAWLPTNEPPAPPAHPSTHQSILSISMHQFKPVSALGNSSHPFILMWVFPALCLRAPPLSHSLSWGTRNWFCLCKLTSANNSTQKRGQGPPNFPGWSLIPQNFMP